MVEADLTLPAERTAPFLVAHRAANDLARLQRARELGMALAEADVHLHAGRLEVRHLKTIGPVPILWDRWELANPLAPRLLLGDVLDAAGEHTELMLDLKGRNPRLTKLVAAALDARPHGAPVTVCSRSWHLLAPLEGRPGVRVLHSVGSRRQLEALRRLLRARAIEGVSIHQRLLDEAVVAELKRHAEVLITWPVESEQEARRLAAWGVDGLISSSFDRLAPALADGVAAP